MLRYEITVLPVFGRDDLEPGEWVVIAHISIDRSCSSEGIAADQIGGRHAGRHDLGPPTLASPASHRPGSLAHLESVTIARRRETEAALKDQPHLFRAAEPAVIGNGLYARLVASSPAVSDQRGRPRLPRFHPVTNLSGEDAAAGDVAAMRAWHMLSDRGVPVLPGLAHVASDAVVVVEQLGGLGSGPFTRLDAM
jgi:hypothetical protein